MSGILEDVDRKISSPHISLQGQGAGKLVQLIISGEVEQSLWRAVMELYWKTLGQGTITSASVAALALPSLVSKGRFKWADAVNKLLNVASTITIHHLPFLTSALGSLLLLHLESQSTSAKYESPFGIKTRPHPLVTLLSTRPDSWHLILEEIDRLLTEKTSSSRAMEMLEPFLKFVFLDPAAPADRVQFRPLLMNLLVARINENGVFEFVLEIFQHQSASNDQHFGSLDAMTRQIVGLLQTIPASKQSSLLATQFVRSLLSVCAEYQFRKVPILALLKSLKNLVDKDLVQEKELLVVTLGYLLHNALQQEQEIIIGLLEHCVLKNAPKYSPATSATLVLPCVNLVLGLHTSSTKTKIVSLLNWAAQTSSNPAPQGVSQDASLEGIRGPLTMILAWHDTLERNWRAQDDTQCKRWFSQILQEAATKGKADATKDEFYPVTTHSLSALVIHPKPSIRAAAVGLFPTLARLSPLQSLRLLPLVLFRLSKENDVAVKHSILHALPGLATDPFSVGPVLKAIQTIGETRSLIPLSTRLLFQLWVVQERIFSHLLGFIQPALKGLVIGDRLSNEIALSAAVTIYNLAEAKAGIYSDPLLPLVSELLGKTSLVAVKVYCLKSINLFCEANSQSPFAVWKVLVEPFSRDSNPAVLAEVIKFYSFLLLEHRLKKEKKEEEEKEKKEQPEEPQQPPEDLVFKIHSRAVDHLLSLAQHPHPSVRSASIAVLGTPQMATILADFERSLPTQAVLSLALTDTDSVAFPAYHQFLRFSVDTELSNLGRRIMTQNSKAADDLPITKLLSPLPATLKTLFESSNRPLVRGGASAALLTCFHGVNDPHAYDLADTSISRKNLLAIWQAGKRFYREGLTEANFTTDWQGRLAAVSSWTKFMKRHILLAAKGTRAERESQGSKEVEEEAEALQRVVKDLIADLKERLREKQSPLFAFNAICALAGVGIASSQLLQSKGFSEAIWDYLMELNKSESLSSEENVAQLLALAHILEGQSGTDIQRIEKTLATLKSAFAKHLRDDDWVSWAAVVGMGILTEASSHDMGRGEVEQAKWNLLLSSVDFIESVTVSQPSPPPHVLLGSFVALVWTIPVLVKDGHEGRRARALGFHDRALQAFSSSATEKQKPSPVSLAQNALLLGYATSTLLAIKALTQAQVLSVLQNLLSEFQRSVKSQPPLVTALITAISVLIHTCEEGGLSFPEGAPFSSGAWNSTLIELLVDFSAHPTIHASAAQGLGILMGSNPLVGGIFLGQSYSLFRPDPALQARHKSTVELLLNVMESPASDPPLSRACAQVIAQLLTLQRTEEGELSSAEPPNYDKLPRESLLRQIFDHLAGRTQKPLSENSALCLLGSLFEGPSPFSRNSAELRGQAIQAKLRLPPVDWSSMVSNLTQPGQFGASIHLLVTKVLLQKASFSTSAVKILARGLEPAHFSSSDFPTKCLLLANLDTFVPLLASTKLISTIEGLKGLLFSADSTESRTLQILFAGFLSESLTNQRLSDAALALIKETIVDLLKSKIPCAIQNKALVKSRVLLLRALSKALGNFAAEERDQIILLKQHLQLSANAGFEAVDDGVNTVILVARLQELGILPIERLHQCFNWCTLSEKHQAHGTLLFPILLGCYKQASNSSDGVVQSLLDSILICPAATSTLSLAFLGNLALLWTTKDSGALFISSSSSTQEETDLELTGLDLAADAIFSDQRLWAWGSKEAAFSLASLSFTLQPLLQGSSQEKAQSQILKRLITLLRSDKPRVFEKAVESALLSLSHLDFFRDSSNWLLLARA